jgi:hypothetical protein
MAGHGLARWPQPRSAPEEYSPITAGYRKPDMMAAALGRIAGCFKQHLNDLSALCRSLVAEVTTAAKACAADMKQQCAGE